MTIHPAAVPAIEAWLRSGTGDTLEVVEPIDLHIPDTLQDYAPAAVSVDLPPTRRVVRQAVRLPGRGPHALPGNGWTLWIGVDAQTGEPLAVTSVAGWRTW